MGTLPSTPRTIRTLIGRRWYVSIDPNIIEGDPLTTPQQLAQACRGLMYLHRLGILHGNITPVSKLCR